jgi:myo-inositol-1(or 4)-monophosphatase
MNEYLQANKHKSRARLKVSVAHVAIQAAHAGSLALMDHFRKPLEVRAKGVANYVSQADLDAESAVVQTILDAFPSHAILSEESHSDRADEDHSWIIDPLDGTNNFIHGIPHFAVSIGYYQKGQGILGIVTSPATGDWFVGARGEGAWFNGQPIRVSHAEGLDQAMIACGFYYDRDQMMQSTLDTLGDLFRRQIHGIRRCGAAALDLAYVAAGWFDGFFEYRLSPWDIAAGAVIIQEAGGMVSDCRGDRIRLDRPSSICASGSELHGKLLEVVSQRFPNDP